MIGDRPIRLEVDGGITRDNAAAVAAAGADTLVAGSAVFRGKSSADYASNIAAIRVAAEAGRVPNLQDISAQTGACRRDRAHPVDYGWIVQPGAVVSVVSRRATFLRGSTEDAAQNDQLVFMPG